MLNNRYQLYKDNNGNKMILNLEILDGFDITPKNSSRYGMRVTKLVVINMLFIEQILKKRMKRKLELYLKFIVDYMDDGNDDGSSLDQILNDIKRYKQILQYKYNKYLGEKQTELLLKKLCLIEKELNVKIYLVKETEKAYEEETKNRRR